MFEHFLIRLAFLESWTRIVAEEHRRPVFERVRAQLDDRASQDGDLRLTVPWACLDCRRR
jgi:hypothetical protein